MLFGDRSRDFSVVRARRICGKKKSFRRESGRTRMMLDTLLCEEGLRLVRMRKNGAFGLEDVIGFLLPAAKQAIDDMVPPFEGMHSFWDIARLTGLATAELTRRSGKWRGTVESPIRRSMRLPKGDGARIFSGARCRGGRNRTERAPTSRPLGTRAVENFPPARRFLVSAPRR